MIHITNQKLEARCIFIQDNIKIDTTKENVATFPKDISKILHLWYTPLSPQNNKETESLKIKDAYKNGNNF